MRCSNRVEVQKSASLNALFTQACKLMNEIEAETARLSTFLSKAASIYDDSESEAERFTRSLQSNANDWLEKAGQLFINKNTDSLRDLIASLSRDSSWLIKNGMKFRLFKKNDRIYVMVIGLMGMTDAQLRTRLGKSIPNIASWTTSRLKRLANDGLRLTNKNGDLFNVQNGESNVKLTDGIGLAELSRTIAGVASRSKSLTAITAILKHIGSSFVESMKPKNVLGDIADDFHGFKDVSNLGKFGKELGALGTVTTIGEDIYDNIVDTHTHSAAQKTVDTIADCTIDLGSGAAATAAGAAIGSFFFPAAGHRRRRWSRLCCQCHS